MLERMSYGLLREVRSADWKSCTRCPGLVELHSGVLSLGLPVTREKDIGVIWDTGALCVIYRGVLRSSVASEVHPSYVPDV